MQYSEYYLTLSGDIKDRYDQKIAIINNIDPYAISLHELSSNVCSFPEVTTIDMMNYLIISHSFYTGQQFKAYKSLQAFKFYEAGFVFDVLGKQISDAFVVLGKVRHSQKAREKPLQVWATVLLDGAISSAHCTCMAGLGEVCSHVAAVLFYLHARPTSETVSCTDTLARWPVPSIKNVEMVRVRDMAWTRKPQVSKGLHVPKMTEEEKIQILRDFQKMDINSAIARVTEPLASEMMQASQTVLPAGLLDNFREEFQALSYEELLKLTETMVVSLESSEITNIEEVTKNQALTNSWFKYRAGRITASKFKAACRAQIEKPPLSLIKGICYPQKMLFYSKQTNYGIKNEKNAIADYFKKIKSEHQDLKIKSIGFLISAEFPVLGASPDGIVECKCCGAGCVEVKCPFILCSVSFEDFLKRKDSCLIRNQETNLINFNEKHMYFFQVQLQMFVTKLKFCDFVLWNKNFIYIKRVAFDATFCKENVEKALKFHKYVIRPELLGKFFTNKSGTGRVRTWCICKIPDDGRPMIKCDNDDCSIEWYHFECVNLIETPNTAWYCNLCT